MRRCILMASVGLAISLSGLAQAQDAKPAKPLPKKTVFVGKAPKGTAMEDSKRFFLYAKDALPAAYEHEFNLQFRESDGPHLLRRDLHFRERVDPFPKLVIEGQTPQTTLTRAKNSNEPIIVIDSKKNVIVRNLTLDGNHGDGPVIEVRNAAVNVTFENIIVKNVGSGPGIAVTSLGTKKESPLIFRNVNIHVEKDGTGMLIHGFPTFDNKTVISLEKVVVDGSPKVGLLIKHPVHDLTLGKDCQFLGAKDSVGDAGILVLSGTRSWIKNLKIQETTFSNFKYGIRFTKVPNVQDLIKMEDSVKFRDVEFKVRGL